MGKLHCCIRIYDTSVVLNFATSYTGADHCRGYAFQEVFGIPVPREFDRFTADGKGELTKWNQVIRTATTDAPTREKLGELGLDYVAEQLA